MQGNLINPLGPRILLASASPRRFELLTLVGARFTAVPVSVDETELPGERAEAHVLRLAEQKARAAVERHARAAGDGDVVVLGADTIVTIDRKLLGKPAGAEDATRMLALLSGRVHEVWTGLFLLDPSGARTVSGAMRSLVRFVKLTPDDIARYIATGEPLDKAGAYAVQGGGAVFVEAIEGSYSNVVGLPLSYLKHLLGLRREAPVPGA